MRARPLLERKVDAGEFDDQARLETALIVIEDVDV